MCALSKRTFRTEHLDVRYTSYWMQLKAANSPFYETSLEFTAFRTPAAGSFDPQNLLLH